VRRFQKSFVVIAVAGVSLQGMALSAAGPQGDQPQPKERYRIVVAHELMTEIHHTIAEMLRQMPQGAPAGVLDDLQAQDRGDYRVQQVDKQTKTLAIGPTGSLELRNIVGDIIVKSGGSREAVVEIVRTSRGRTDADAKLGLERVTVETSVQGTRGTVTAVSARNPDERRPPYAVSTAYTVTVPAGARVAAHSISGNVRLSGVKGEISADTISGDLDIQDAANVDSLKTMSGKVSVTGTQSDGTIDVGIVSGSVILTDVKARRVSVSAVSGPVVAKGVTAASASVTSLSGDIDYAGPVSASGRYEFQTHSGEIRLGLSGGFTFEGRSFSGTVQGDQGLSLTRSAGGRSVARGTQGNGGAVVAATTFSGNVKVSGK